MKIFLTFFFVLLGITSNSNAHYYTDYNPKFAYESWLFDYDQSPMFRVIPPDPTLVTCTVTPFVESKDSGPDIFPHSNNLAKPVGGADYVDGELIVVSIRVVDKNCVPVPDAIVSVWQKNMFGYYQYKQKSISDKQQKAKIYQKDFIGAGKAITDNLGFANFLTIYPNSNEDEPHLNLRIAHKALGEIETLMFFASAEKEEDFSYKCLSQENVRKLTSFGKRYYDEFGTYIVYFYTITYDGVVGYKHY